jgi:type VI secretion system ImpM family protein
MTLDSIPGFYGKLPVRGDFVGRRFGARFIEPWDKWLQEAILASRTELGDRWLDLYLSGPIWRFALGANVCGPDTVAGVMIPSVDKVGRFFPLMIGRAFEGDADLVALVSGSDQWYGAIEARILTTLDSGFTLESLDAPLQLEPCFEIAAAQGEYPLLPPGCRFPIDADRRPDAAALDLLRRSSPPLSMWWTDGADKVRPSCLVAPGLPAARSFAAMLDGRWTERSWTMPEPDAEDSDLEEVTNPGIGNDSILAAAVAAAVVVNTSDFTWESSAAEAPATEAPGAAADPSRTASSMRLPLIPPKALTPEQRPLYDDMKAGIASNFSDFRTISDDGALIGPWNAWLHEPQIGTAIWNLTKAMTAQASLPAPVRQVAILVVGAHFHAAYELYAHIAVAEREGMSAARLSTLVAGCRPGDLTDDEGCAYDVAFALCGGGVLPEPCYARAVALFGQHGANELIYLVGLYCLVSTTLNGFNIPVPERQ